MAGAYSQDLRDRVIDAADDAKILQVVDVSFGSTEPSISLSRNGASYCPRPRPRSQTPTSILAS